MPMNDRNHPIWGAINLIVVCATAVIFSLTTASNVDETEFKMWAGIFLSYGGYEVLKPKIRSWLGMEDEKSEK